jgi:hypothetical protein
MVFSSQLRFEDSMLGWELLNKVIYVNFSKSWRSQEILHFRSPGSEFFFNLELCDTRNLYLFIVFECS